MTSALTAVWTHSPWLLKAGAISTAAVCGTTYAAPIALWGAGAMESTARAVGNVAAAGISLVLLQPNWAETQIQQARQNGQMAFGCGMLSALSCIPLIGTYYGVSHFSTEVNKYQRVRSAVDRAQKNARTAESVQLMDQAAQCDCGEADLKRLFDQSKDLKYRDVRIYQEDFGNYGRQLDGTLIHRNYLYTTGYYTVKGLEEITERIFTNGYVKRAIKYSWHRAVDGTRFTYNCLSDEVVCAIGLVTHPKGPSWKEGLENKVWRWTK